MIHYSLVPTNGELVKSVENLNNRFGRSQTLDEPVDITREKYGDLLKTFLNYLETADIPE